MTGINLRIFKGNNNERFVTCAKFSMLVGLWLLDLKQSPTEVSSRSPVCMPGCSCSYPPMSKEALHRGDEDCSDTLQSEPANQRVNLNVFLYTRIISN